MPDGVVPLLPPVGIVTIACARSYRGNNHTRVQVNQALEVAAIQGQREHRRVAYGSAQGRIRGIDRRGFRGHSNGLGLRAGLEGEI